MIDNDLLISCEELLGRLDDEHVRIIDCRFNLTEPGAGRAQYLESHIPNAVYADLDQDLAAASGPDTGRHPLPDIDAFATTLGRLGIGNETHVIVYDQSSGALAARLWWLLRWAGHGRASLLDGGIARWQALRMPLETGQQYVVETRFVPAVRQNLVVDVSEIEAALPDVGALRLVDAREPQRFLGIEEPIDPVAGHIPGALNVPFASYLQADGRWENADNLHALLQKALGNSLNSPWSVMCGSGVTACHLVVSALLTGLPEPRVYVGSWSEWIRDPDRPVVGSDDAKSPPNHAEGT